MRQLLIGIVILAATLVVGQDIQHAQTVEQCHADHNLWTANVENESYLGETVTQWSKKH